jgi:hypothetical protein
MVISNMNSYFFHFLDNYLIFNYFNKKCIIILINKKIMPSFDVISKVNYQEFDNALANCLREISNRYDLKALIFQ